MPKTKKNKKQPTVILIPRIDEATGEIREPYRIMEELIPKYHDHLAEAKIALAWNLSWKADVDGHLKLGQCMKVPLVHNELHEFDFIIQLNQQVWNTAEFTERHRIALIDHELCHADVVIDDNDDMKRDARGKIVYRLRKHDVEEFGEIIHRNGIWKSDLEAFAKICIQKSKTPLLLRAEQTPAAVQG
jgi:Putative phage metallopeptidase